MPDRGAVTQNLRGAILEPGGQLGLVLRIALIDRRECADRQTPGGELAQVAIFLALGIPDNAGATHPLGQPLRLLCRGLRLVSNARQHEETIPYKSTSCYSSIKQQRQVFNEKICRRTVRARRNPLVIRWQTPRKAWPLTRS